jgi:uncharacterized Fe-S radical SAM superfamily protein PflX
MSEQEFKEFWKEVDAAVEQSRVVPKKNPAKKLDKKRRFIQRAGEDCKTCRSCMDKILNGGFGVRKRACETRRIIVLSVKND